jgi:hypothetical protein
MPKIFSPMITTSGTPQSQRMMLFMKVSVLWVCVQLGRCAAAAMPENAFHARGRVPTVLLI